MNSKLDLETKTLITENDLDLMLSHCLNYYLGRENTDIEDKGLIHEIITNIPGLFGR